MSDLADRLNAALAGRYRVERELGRGGMGTVFLAQDLKHPRRVAIKVLLPELAAAIGAERFQREIELAAGLSHPHIMPLHESGSADSLLYFVMPYAEGESLRQRLEREKQLPLADAVRIAREVAGALDFAHRRGIVHRDIKPENILIVDRHAVLADFGIARAIQAAGGEKLTATGVTIGTPAYMSPEQAAGSPELDGRSDLYALGCVLYEMLAGNPPFTGPNAWAIQARHAFDPVPPLRTVRPAVPDAIERAVTKALAKAPADRHATAAEFAAAMAASESPAGTEGQRRKPGRAFAGVGAVLAIAIAGVWISGPWVSKLLHPQSSAGAGMKDWIVVADFDGPADDSSLAVTTRDLVSAALDQSQIVATVPQDQIQLALERAGKSADSRVDPGVARELAYRSAVRAIVEGKIGRLGQGYSVVLRVVDAESLKVILTERAVAKDEDALIPTLGRLAERLSAGLGEKRGAIRASGEMVATAIPAATPSFEAYRLFVQGRRLILSLRSQDAIPVLRDAVALDPDFAHAWLIMGAAFNNLGEMDSALAAYDEALRHTQRLTPEQRLFAAGVRASADGDLRTALAASERALEADRTSAEALMLRGYFLWGLGRFEEALESTRMSTRSSPFGATQLVRANELGNLCNLGRVDEAREVARYISGKQQHASWRMTIEMQASNWAATERIADTLIADPGLDGDGRADALLMLASAQAARGALKAAAGTFARAEEAARGTSTPKVYQNYARRGRLMLAIVSDGAIPIPPDAWTRDSSTTALITCSLRAAIAGDRAQAQRLLSAARGRSRRELVWQGATPALLDARIEALAGRWGEAARILQPVASQRVEIGTRIPGRAGMSPLRWFLADAFEKLGQPDSAAVTLERVTSDPAPARWEFHLRGVVQPFAHRRLVLLYARMGRIEDAKRHWQIFTETVRTPDPEIQPLIEEARAALATAEGMAKSVRR